MKGCEFHGQTRALNPPEGWDQEQVKCIPLGIRDFDMDGYPAMESVWVPTPEERLLILNGANISLVIVGSRHPPVSVGLSTVKVLDEDPFVETR